MICSLIGLYPSTHVAVVFLWWILHPFSSYHLPFHEYTIIFPSSVVNLPWPIHHNSYTPSTFIPALAIACSTTCCFPADMLHTFHVTNFITFLRGVLFFSLPVPSGSGLPAAGFGPDPSSHIGVLGAASPPVALDVSSGMRDPPSDTTSFFLWFRTLMMTNNHAKKFELLELQWNTVYSIE